MQINPSIILSGQQPDFVNTLARSTQAAQMANQNRDQNALRQLFQTQGPQIMAGEGNALNSLAQIDPNAALGIQGARQDMQAQQQRMGILSAAEKRAVQEHAMRMSAAERQQQAAQVQQGIMQGISLYRAGDLNGLNQMLTGVGEAPIPSLDAFPGLAAKYNGVLEVLTELRDYDAGPSGKTEAEREIGRLTSLGMSRDVAVKIKEGVYKLATDPQTGLHTIIDLSTGGPVSGAQSPAAESTQKAQSDPVEYRFGDQFQSPGTSFGIGGAARSVANTVADSAGLPVPFAETQQTQSDFGVLREQLINDISSGYNRQPPGWLLKNIEALTPQAGSPFQGAEGAKTKLKSIGRSLDGEVKNIRRQLQRPMRETSRQELEAKLSGLESALSRVDAALFSFDKDEGGNVTSSGVKWKVVE